MNDTELYTLQVRHEEAIAMLQGIKDFNRRAAENDDTYKVLIKVLPATAKKHQNLALVQRACAKRLEEKYIAFCLTLASTSAN